MMMTKYFMSPSHLSQGHLIEFSEKKKKRNIDRSGIQHKQGL